MNRLKIIAVLLLAAVLPTACGNLNDNKKISIALSLIHIYAYMNNIYSCRKIEKHLLRDIHYIWPVSYTHLDVYKRQA